MREIPKKINIHLFEHEKTGLLVAVSPEVPGLYVHGSSEEEINARIPLAIKALQEADEKLAAEKKAKLAADRLAAGFAKTRVYELEAA